MNGHKKSPKNILAKGSPIKGPITLKPIAPSTTSTTTTTVSTSVLQKTQNMSKLTKKQTNQQTVHQHQQQQQQQPRAILINNQFLTTSNGKVPTAIYPSPNQLYQTTTGTSTPSNGHQTQQQTSNGPILMSTATPGQYQVVSAAPTSQYFQIVPISSGQQPFIFAAQQNPQQQRSSTNHQPPPPPPSSSSSSSSTPHPQTVYTAPNGQVYIHHPQQQQQQQQQQQPTIEQQQQMNQFQQIQQQLLRQFATNSAAAAAVAAATSNGSNQQQQPQLLNYNPFGYSLPPPLLQHPQPQPQIQTNTSKPSQPQQQQQQQQKKSITSKGSPIKTENLNLSKTTQRNDSPIKANHSTASTSSPSAYSSGGGSLETSPNIITTVTGGTTSTSTTHQQKRENTSNNQIENKKFKKANKIQFNDSMDVDSNLNSKKGRGRPRMYVQDPVTGKSIKGQFINDNGVQIMESSSQDDQEMKLVDEPQQQQQQQQVITTNAEEIPKEKVEQNKVLTHIIEGYVIKESSEPFPLKSIVNNVNDGYPKQQQQQPTPEQEETKQQQHQQETPIVIPPPTSKNTPQKQELGDCLECGKREKLVKSKKFCSIECFKKYNSTSKGKEKRPKIFHLLKLLIKIEIKIKSKKRLLETSHNESINNQSMIIANNNNENSSNELINDIPSLTNGYHSPKLNNFQTTFNRSPLLNNSNSIQTSTTIDADGYEIPIGNPIEWNCDQVYTFVKTIAGPTVAHTFKIQEVDGSALMLIKDDHLVNTMQIKLGPALKILYKFNEIRAKFK